MESKSIFFFRGSTGGYSFFSPYPHSPGEAMTLNILYAEFMDSSWSKRKHCKLSNGHFGADISEIC